LSRTTTIREEATTASIFFRRDFSVLSRPSHQEKQQRKKNEQGKKFVDGEKKNSKE
jgi:hypothetical protein